MEWLKVEEDYLDSMEVLCMEQSKLYHDVYFEKRRTHLRLKVPAIIVGSFTGVASFGTTTFPSVLQLYVPIIVGIINICIAILNACDTFFKISEDMNLARSTSEQLKKLAEDINKETKIPANLRQTNGITFLSEAYTRYQQINNNAPMLKKYVSYLEIESMIENKRRAEQCFIDVQTSTTEVSQPLNTSDEVADDISFYLTQPPLPKQVGESTDASKSPSVMTTNDVENGTNNV